MTPLARAFVEAFDPRRDMLIVPTLQKDGTYGTRTLHRPPSQVFSERVERHLTGAHPLDRIGFRLKRDASGGNAPGLARIEKRHGFTSAGAIDLDAHEMDAPDRWRDALRLLGAFHHHGFTAYIERSKGGRGCHLWAFFEGRIPVDAWQAKAKALLIEAGVFKTEVYPTEGERGGAAPWTPYFGWQAAEMTGLTAFIDPWNHRPLSLEWFLTHLERNAAAMVPPLPVKVKARTMKGACTWKRGKAAGNPKPFPVAHEGNRNITAARVAGMILQRGGSWNDLVSWNLFQCPKPLEGGELLKVWNSIEKRRNANVQG